MGLHHSAMYSAHFISTQYTVHSTIPSAHYSSTQYNVQRTIYQYTVHCTVHTTSEHFNKVPLAPTERLDRGEILLLRQVIQ